jgi:uridine kinase
MVIPRLNIDDIRLCRRIKRDTVERGRTIVGVLAQYNKFVKNAFRDFIYPTIGYADLVIPGSRNNRISVDFIVQHIKNVARKKNIFKTAQDTKVFLFG